MSDLPPCPDTVSLDSENWLFVKRATSLHAFLKWLLTGQFHQDRSGGMARTRFGGNLKHDAMVPYRAMLAVVQFPLGPGSIGNLFTHDRIRRSFRSAFICNIKSVVIASVAD
jgi:hypothetical protein